MKEYAWAAQLANRNVNKAINNRRGSRRSQMRHMSRSSYAKNGMNDFHAVVAPSIIA